jgi:adenine-specific DNA methylase
MVTTAGSTRLHRTIWYMGAKSRLIPGFLERVLDREIHPGATVVDLMSGSGVVSAFCADRYRVFSNDVQTYSSLIASSLIEHDPDEKEAFLLCLAPESDLETSFDGNFDQLARRYSKELREEDAFLAEFGETGGDGDWPARYREFLERFVAVFPAEPVPRDAGLSLGASWLLSPKENGRRRRNPLVRPACLLTTYYANVYFGLRQALVLDSLRAAIDDLDPQSPFFERRRVHYLSALIHVASVSTSGTSHFAQPRHLTKDSELRAMVKRRLIDVRELFEEQCESVAETVRTTKHHRGNRVLGGDYQTLLRDDGSLEFPGDVDLVYLDPPYTSDNYSRFYHVLEALACYDYPELERGRDGKILRGRYPVIAGRFQSDFCKPARVEGEFRRVAEGCAKSGAKLVVSYSHPTGLLLKQRARKGDPDPVESFRQLFLESYKSVEVLRQPLTHSGQGDSNLQIEELLLVCSRPRATTRASSRGYSRKRA